MRGLFLLSAGRLHVSTAADRTPRGRRLVNGFDNRIRSAECGLKNCLSGRFLKGIFAADVFTGAWRTAGKLELSMLGLGRSQARDIGEGARVSTRGHCNHVDRGRAEGGARP
jgi:hypothetical protein